MPRFPLCRFGSGGALINIYLDHAHQLRKVFILHGRTNPMAHVPCGLFFLETHNPLNVQGTDSLLRIQHQERDSEPFPQGTLGILEDSPADYRKPIAIATTAISLLTNPMERTMGYVKDFLATALGTVDSSGPTLRYQITLAGFFVRERFEMFFERHAL